MQQASIIHAYSQHNKELTEVVYNVLLDLGLPWPATSPLLLQHDPAQKEARLQSFVEIQAWSTVGVFLGDPRQKGRVVRLAKESGLEKLIELRHLPRHRIPHPDSNLASPLSILSALPPVAAPHPSGYNLQRATTCYRGNPIHCKIGEGLPSVAISICKHNLSRSDYGVILREQLHTCDRHPEMAMILVDMLLCSMRMKWPTSDELLDGSWLRTPESNVVMREVVLHRAATLSPSAHTPTLKGLGKRKRRGSAKRPAAVGGDRENCPPLNQPCLYSAPAAREAKPMPSFPLQPTLQAVFHPPYSGPPQANGFGALEQQSGGIEGHRQQMIDLPLFPPSLFSQPTSSSSLSHEPVSSLHLATPQSWSQSAQPALSVREIVTPPALGMTQSLPGPAGPPPSQPPPRLPPPPAPPIPHLGYFIAQPLVQFPASQQPVELSVVKPAPQTSPPTLNAPLNEEDLMGVEPFCAVGGGQDFTLPQERELLNDPALLDFAAMITDFATPPAPPAGAVEDPDFAAADEFFPLHL